MYRGCFSLGCMCKTGWGKAVLEDIHLYVRNQIMYLHLGRLSLGNLVKNFVVSGLLQVFAGQGDFRLWYPLSAAGSAGQDPSSRAGDLTQMAIVNQIPLEDDFMTANGMKDDESTWSCNMLQQPPGGHFSRWQKSQKAKHGTTGPRLLSWLRDSRWGIWWIFFPSKWRKIGRPGKVNNFFIFPGMSFGAVLLGRS